MKLRYEDITKENKACAEQLSVTSEQEAYIESVKQCLQEADELSIWKPVAIYHGNTMIGFAMYGYFQKEGKNGRLWLDRFLIDKSFQGKGYAKQALSDLLRRLKESYECNEIYLSVKNETIPAVHLYQKYGFVFNGEIDEKGEKLMVHKI